MDSAGFQAMFSPSTGVHNSSTVEVVEIEGVDVHEGREEEPKVGEDGRGSSPQIHLIDSNRLVIRLLKSPSFLRISSTFLIE